MRGVDLCLSHTHTLSLYRGGSLWGERENVRDAKIPVIPTGLALTVLSRSDGFSRFSGPISPIDGIERDSHSP